MAERKHHHHELNLLSVLITHKIQIYVTNLLPYWVGYRTYSVRVTPSGRRKPLDLILLKLLTGLAALANGKSLN